MVIESDSPPADPTSDFEDFLKNFEEIPNEFKYRQKISEAYARSDNHITILFEDILHFNPPLANYLKIQPEQALQEAAESFKNIIRIDAGGRFNPNDEYTIRISTHNNSNEVPLHLIRAKHIDKLLFIKGIIIRASVVRPKITNATFECPICGNIMQEEQTTTKLSAPQECTNPNCKNKRDFKVDTMQSEFINHQMITLQEAPEDLRPGDIPKTLQAIIHNELVDTVRPGERVKIMGILKSVPKEDQRGRLSTVFHIQLFCNNIEGIKQTDEELDLTQEDIDEILSLSQEPMIQRKVTRSIARAILGYEHLKMAAGLSLFGGNQKLKKDGSKLRGDIHVLFMGDPGTGKSQILQNCAKIAQRSVYTSGKGASAAGLCVSGDTEIIFDNKIQNIKDVVESKFQSQKINVYNETMEYVENLNDTHKILKSTDLKIIPDKISRFWKIKSPHKIVSITTKTGKKLKLTPQTPLKIIDKDKGIIWKSAEELKIGNKVAIAQKLKNMKEISIPTIYSILKSYKGKITILNIELLIKNIFDSIKNKKGFNNKELSEKLNVSESTIFNWTSKTTKGSISFSKFREICEISNGKIEEILPETISVQIKNDQTIIIPKYFDEKWFYMLGILMGDGRVSEGKHEGSYGGISIGLSNREPELLIFFKNFFSSLNLHCSITEGNETRPTEYRIHSKLIYHIFHFFGLSPSPKSNLLHPNNSILFYPEKYLFEMIKGLYDGDGWISIPKDHSHEIGFVSTSKALTNFVRYALCKLGIISFLKVRSSTTSIKKDGTKIVGKLLKYTLSFSQFGDFLIFKRNIGFSHPEKKKKLELSCSFYREKHSNYDNIPNIRRIFNKIIHFYHQPSSLFTGHKGSFSPYNEYKSISIESLKKYLKILTPNWKNHKIILPIDFKNSLYKEILNYTSNKKLKEILQITKSEYYELFLTKNRKTPISAGKIMILREKFKSQLSDKFSNELNEILNEIKKQDKFYQEKIKELIILCKSDIYWDEIKQIEIHSTDDDYVYDLTVPNNHNFLANLFITHNTAAVIKESDNTGMQLEAGALVLASGGTACIDEFDKMRNQDRSAIHEAMEQQSYSYDFEIMLANGQKYEIGKYIEDLMNNQKDDIIQGKNCQILDLSKNQLPIHSFDLISNTMKTFNINRASKHIAPIEMYEIHYSNGRKITVTPEHPIFIQGKNGITTIEAQNLEVDEYAPALIQYHFSGDTNLKYLPLTGRKEISLPLNFTPSFAKFLGYYIAEGYNYAGSSYEVGLSNTNKLIIEDMISLIKNLFSIDPIDNTLNNRTVRIISKDVYNFLLLNFPVMFKKAEQKRISPILFRVEKEHICNFLAAAFDGDGSVESTACAYSTISKRLAEDYQDLLLVLGVSTRIVSENYQTPKSKENKIRYKVYIRGDSLNLFNELIGQKTLLKRERFSRLVDKSNNTNRHHDIVPPKSIELLVKCMENLNISGKSYFWQHIKKKHGATKQIVKPIIKKIIEQSLHTNYSAEIRNDIKQLEASLQYRWLKINKINKIEFSNLKSPTNQVYDLTIEPTHNFASCGLVLHNTVSIAKAGIVATLQAKTAIIAAANPKHGRWNDHESASANINLGAPILSRFDLIFIVRDIPERNNDVRIAEYILNNHMQGYDETFTEEDEAQKQAKREEFIPMELFKKYIQYCKNNCHPKLTREAASEIQNFYVKMRSSNPDNPATVSIVARTLDGMVRMSEAYAKMGLKDFVTVEHTQAIIKLLERSLRDIGYDEETGRIDMDMMLTGVSSNKRNKLNLILEKIRELQTEDPVQGLTLDDIFEPLSSIEGMTKLFVQQSLEQWYKDGTLYCPRNGLYKLPNSSKQPKK